MCLRPTRLRSAPSCIGPSASPLDRDRDHAKASPRPDKVNATEPTKAVPEGRAADLLAGRGMGLALAAELNGHPGLMHVLEQADALRPTPAQRAAAEASRGRMTGEVRAVGARIAALEEELDRLFANRTADADRPRSAPIVARPETAAVPAASPRCRREARMGRRLAEGRRA